MVEIIVVITFVLALEDNYFITQEVVLIFRINDVEILRVPDKPAEIHISSVIVNRVVLTTVLIVEVIVMVLYDLATVIA